MNHHKSTRSIVVSICRTRFCPFLWGIANSGGIGILGMGADGAACLSGGRVMFGKRNFFNENEGYYE